MDTILEALNESAAALGGVSVAVMLGTIIKPLDLLLASIIIAGLILFIDKNNKDLVKFAVGLVVGAILVLAYDYFGKDNESKIGPISDLIFESNTKTEETISNVPSTETQEATTSVPSTVATTYYSF